MNNKLINYQKNNIVMSITEKKKKKNGINSILGRIRIHYSRNRIRKHWIQSRYISLKCNIILR